MYVRANAFFSSFLLLHSRPSTVFNRHARSTLFAVTTAISVRVRRLPCMYAGRPSVIAYSTALAPLRQPITVTLTRKCHIPVQKLFFALPFPSFPLTVMRHVPARRHARPSVTRCVRMCLCNGSKIGVRPQIPTHATDRITNTIYTSSFQSFFALHGPF